MNQRSTKKYNGWSNYETWAVNLWISNEEASYVRWRDRTRQLLSESVTEEKAGLVMARLADEIRDEITEQCAIPKANLAADLMNAALGAVDWHEIAQDLLDDANVTASLHGKPEPEDDDVL